MGNMQWEIRQSINARIPDTDLHPVITQLLLQRDIATKQDVENFFAPDYTTDLHDPFLFVAMNKVVERVTRAREVNEIIGIFGDHDADGVSSATVLAEGLEQIGCTVHVYIPDKITEGHGLNTNALDFFVEKNVSLVFTVDCGTSNIDPVADANSRAIDVIITDHHHAPDVLPQAYAIINPQIAGSGYPFTELSGTAVAFKVVQALHSVLFPENLPQLKWLLDVVCVGTIADCMALVGENRTLVAYGLKVLSKTRRIGYQELISVGNIAIVPNKIPKSDTVAFHIAPRINAPGRMSHAKNAYALMRATDQVQAQKYAQMIEAQNIERRRLVDTFTRDVEKIVQKDFQDKSFIVIASRDYPVGIVGIIAGQIAEKYHKPTGIFTQFDTESRGSFRSVDGVHIVNVLDHCSDYLLKYGGHEKAAGASIKNDKIVDFARAADLYTRELLHGKDIAMVRVADSSIDLADVDHDFLATLKKFAPFGQKNEEPIFYVKDVIIDQLRMVGSGAKHMKIRVTQEGMRHSVDGIGFGLGVTHGDLVVGDRVDVIAHIQENEWMGNVSVQLNIIDVQYN